MKNPVDRVKINCLVYGDRGQFMGMATVKCRIEWLTKNAEEIPIEELTILRKWIPPEDGHDLMNKTGHHAPTMKGE